MTKTSRTIKSLPVIDRPREKLVRYGPEKLSHSELLALLFRTGKKGENAVEFAQKFLRHFDAQTLPHLTYTDIAAYQGIGPAKASEIVACFELGKRLLQGKKSKIYLTAREVWQELKDIRSLKKEHFVVFYLDSRNQEIKREVISVGILDEALLHPREVFEPAVRNIASHIILAHNHPDGEVTPSHEDILITKRLAASGSLLGIELADHVIVTDERYVSMREKGLL